VTALLLRHQRHFRRASLVLVGLFALVGAACGEKAVLLARSEGDGGAASGGASSFSPTPVLVADVDIRAGGPFSRLLVGDLNGDGRFDLLTMQPDVTTDNELPHAVVALTAFELDGNQLWQVGTPDPKATGSASDIPAQIYDLDGDGDNEVIAVMADELLVLEGKTGKVEQRRSLPDPNAHDAIIIANLSGHARPDDVILKNRFDTLWAYNRDFDLLFTFKGTLGYYPWPYDWNGDGRDELAAGTSFLSADGKELWSCASDTDTTVDSVWSGDLDPRSNNGPEVIIGGGNTLVFGRDGTKRFAIDTVEAQNLAVADFRPDMDGLEIAGLDRIERTQNGRDALFVLSARGTLLAQEERPAGSGWSTILGMIHDWDGTGRDYLLAFGRSGEPPTLYDGKLNSVTTLPESSALLMTADLCGDARTEIIAYSDSFARIYATADCPLDSHVTHVPREQPKALYNWTRYWGGDAR
jgi:hypothetical protein